MQSEQELTPKPQSSRDIFLLFCTRIIRLFCYGFLSIILALYLVQAGLDEREVGLLFTLTLAGDAGISLWLTTSADRFGRKRTLIVGALLMLGAGVAFVLSHDLWVLMAAAIIGVISPSGNEIGPFLSVEQAALTHLLPDQRRTQAFAWYNLAGSFATAIGALSGGWLAQVLQARGLSALSAYRVVLMGYAVGELVLGLLFSLLSGAIEAGTAFQGSAARRCPRPASLAQRGPQAKRPFFHGRFCRRADRAIHDRLLVPSQVWG